MLLIKIKMTSWRPWKGTRTKEKTFARAIKSVDTQSAEVMSQLVFYTAPQDAAYLRQTHKLQLKYVSLINHTSVMLP